MLVSKTEVVREVVVGVIFDEEIEFFLICRKGATVVFVEWI